MRDSAEAVAQLRLDGFGNCSDADVLDEVGPANKGAANRAGWQHGTRPDLVAAFFAEVAHVQLLTRKEEEALAAEVSVRREKIRKLLCGRPRVVDEALQGAGRGLVHPEEDFREREALVILTHACRRLGSMGREQRGSKALSRFVTDLQAQLAAYRKLRDRMMTANVRLVMTLARRYRHPTLSYLDLVQEGTLGLMRAVEKYQPSRGIKFSTYAVWWIWQQISRAADCQGAVVRTPVQWNQVRRKLGRAERQANGNSGAEQSADGNGGVSLQQLAAMESSFQCLSLTTPLGDGDERTIADTLAADPTDSPEGATLASELNRRLATAVEELPARDAEILRLRFGLNGSEEFTLEEVGRRLGVSRERVRQLEVRALKQMRAICDARGLAEMLH